MAEQNTPAPADLVEAVTCAIYGEDNLNGLGNVADAMRQRGIAAITAMQAYMASDGVTQMDRDLYAKLLRSLGHEAFAQDAADGVDDDDEPLHDIAAHRRGAAITPQPYPRDQVIDYILAVMGNVRHDRPGDSNDAMARGIMLEAIRAIARTGLAKSEGK